MDLKPFSFLPLSQKSFVLQILFGFFLMFLVFFYKLDKLSFLFAFFFANFYMILFFFLGKSLFSERRKKLWTLPLFLVKVLILLLVLLALNFLIIDEVSFLLGLSAVFSFITLYILENRKGINKK